MGGKCGVEKDRAYINGLIMQRGGYERLDDGIKQFREQMYEELQVLLDSTCQNTTPYAACSNTASTFMSWKSLDWNDSVEEDYGNGWGSDIGFVRSKRTWKYHAEWCKAMDRVREAFDGPEYILSPYHRVGYYGVKEKWSYEGACPL